MRVSDEESRNEIGGHRGPPYWILTTGYSKLLPCALRLIYSMPLAACALFSSLFLGAVDKLTS